MAAKAKTNLLIGAKVCIDYPNRWRGAKDEATRQRMRAETEASKTSMDGHGAYFFGETGLIVNYNPGDERGKCYDILLDSNHEVESLNDCEFTVTELPKPDAEVVVLLSSILEVLHAIKNKLK
jgi:hypothetical protein